MSVDSGNAIKAEYVCRKCGGKWVFNAGAEIECPECLQRDQFVPLKARPVSGGATVKATVASVLAEAVSKIEPIHEPEEDMALQDKVAALELEIEQIKAEMAKWTTDHAVKARRKTDQEAAMRKRMAHPRFVAIAKRCDDDAARVCGVILANGNRPVSIAWVAEQVGVKASRLHGLVAVSRRHLFERVDVPTTVSETGRVSTRVLFRVKAEASRPQTVRV